MRRDTRFPVATPTLPVYINAGQPILCPIWTEPMPLSPATRLDRHTPAVAAAVLSQVATLRLADGTLAEHRLLAMASDLWAERPEASDPSWIASEWNGATIAFRIYT